MAEQTINFGADHRVGGLPYLFRDVFWCWVLNEPVMLTYTNDDYPCCSLCDWTYGIRPDEIETWKRLKVSHRTSVQLPDDFLGGPGHHQFICHIFKPGRET